MWTVQQFKELQRKLMVLKPRITEGGELIYGISYKDVQLTYEEFLKISASYSDYNTFLTEECLRFEAFVGKPVVETFDPSIHCRSYPGINKSLPLCLSFDFGGSNPAYVISQYDSGTLHLHDTDKPSRTEFKEVNLESICKQLKSEFNNPLSEYYNENEWKYVLVGDHSGTDPNSHGTSRAAEVLQREFGAAMLSTRFNQQIAQESLALINDVFSRTTLVTVNPSSERLRRLLSGAWHYPEKMEKQYHPKPEADGYWIHMGDALKYLIYNFFRTARTSEDMLVEVPDPWGL